MTLIKKYFKYFRIYFLLNVKYKFKKTGKSFYCGKNLSIRKDTVTVGNNVFIGSYANLAVKELFIGDYTMLAPRVAIVGGDHRFDVVGMPCCFSGRDIEKPVYIGKDAWIGYGTIILHGVIVGDGSIVAAGSIVTKDVESFCIYAGQPAKKIRDRFLNDDDKLKHIEALGL